MVRFEFKSKISSRGDSLYIRIPKAIEPIIRKYHGKWVLVRVEVFEDSNDKYRIKKYNKVLNTLDILLNYWGIILLLYGEHCVPFAVISKRYLRFIQCPLCGKSVESFSIRRYLKGYYYILNKENRCEIDSKADGFLRYILDKREFIHNHYEESSLSLIDDILILIHGLTDLNIGSLVKIYSDYLGMLYVAVALKGDFQDKAFEFLEGYDLRKVGLLSLARMWFKVSGNKLNEVITNYIIAKSIIGIKPNIDPSQYRVLLGNAYTLLLDTMNQVNSIISNKDKFDESMINEIKMLRENIIDLKNMLKEAYYQAIKSESIYVSSRLISNAIENLAILLSKSIERHGEIVREGLIKIANSVEYMGDRISEGLKSVSASLGYVATSIEKLAGATMAHARAIEKASSNISKAYLIGSVAKGILIGGGILGGSYLLSRTNNIVRNVTNPIFSNIMR